MSDALITQGTLLEVGQGTTPETYIAVGEVTDWDGPGGEAPEIDVSHLQSVKKEYKLGLPDSGDMTYNCQLVPGNAGQLRIIQLHDAKASATFRLTYSDLTTRRTFTAFVRRYREAGAKDNVVRAAITLRVTGDIART